MAEAPLLKVRGIARLLWRIACAARRRVWRSGRAKIVTLLGRNGAGKTTTLKSIMGMMAKRRGSIRFAGVETIALSSDRIARLGIALCPEERGIFASLSVEENLLLPPKIAPGGLSLDEIFELFPNLRERLRSPGGKFRAANSRCWRSAASCAPAPAC